MVIASTQTRSRIQNARSTDISKDTFPQNLEFHRTSVFWPRVVVALILLSAILFPRVYQPALTWIWNTLYRSRFYNWSTFETIETVLFYSLIEIRYTIKFFKSPKRRFDVRGTAGRSLGEGPPNRLKGMRRPGRRMFEIVTYIVPLLALDFVLIKKFAGVDVESIRLSGGYPATNDGAISSWFLSPTVHNFSWSSPLQIGRALPAEAASSRRLALELLASLFIYDALFFWTHYAFHKISLLRTLHLPHHKHGEMNPQVTNRLSIPERLSLVLLANFSLNIIKSHVLTRTLFVPLFVYLLVDIHSGLDLDWSYDKILPKGWGAGSAAHAAHHRTGDGHYAPFFNWWDRLAERFE